MGPYLEDRTLSDNTLDIRTLVADEIKAALADVKSAVADIAPKSTPEVAAREEEPEETPEAVKTPSKFGRYARALIRCRGDVDRAADWVFKTYHDEETARALSSTDMALGGALIAPEYASEVIELLRAKTVVRKLGARIIPMETGTLNIPRQTSGVTGAYIGADGESDIAAESVGTGMLTLTWKKLATLVPISNDLLLLSGVDADRFVRDDIVRSLRIREDKAFLRDDGTQNKPKGLRYWAASGNVIAANATVNLTNTVTDLRKLVNALEQSNVEMDQPAWIFSPRTKNYLMTVQDGNGNFVFRDEMLRGTLWDFPYGVTTSVPNNLGAGSDESEIYLVDFAHVIIGESSQLVIVASSEATYNDGAGLRSAFSRDETVIRAILRHDFAVRHQEAVAVLTGVKWGA